MAKDAEGNQVALSTRLGHAHLGPVDQPGDIGRIGVEMDFVETGLQDSLKFVELLMELEQRFGMRIPLNDLGIDSLRSIAKMADFAVNHNGLPEKT